MLYYSGHTRRLGNVDEGSTVTDFLPAERARGITIQSAAITFEWPPRSPDTGTNEIERQAEARGLLKSSASHTVNLIDTPGHADFTFEVRRSLRILDGAVCVLDGVAGVEAQTEQVWSQAGEWKIPRIAFVNKLDRDGAAFARTVKEIGTRLGGWPAICQIPWWEGGKGQFTGVADVISMRGLHYDPQGDGKTIKAVDFATLQTMEPTLAAELQKARFALVELLSGHDESMIETFLEHNEDHFAISETEIIDSIRRCLLSQSNLQGNQDVIPVFAGASFRNIGIQPLLDAVVNLLPDPSERPDPEVSFGNVKGGLQDFLSGKLALRAVGNATKGKKGVMANTPPHTLLEGCALAFKVVNDARKGPLVYVRVYSGTITRNALLYNTNLHLSERPPTLLRMYASESVAVNSLSAGQIGVLVGLKHARTGDTLIAYPGAKPTPPEPLTYLQLRPINVPPPVFFASLEANSLKDEKAVKDAVAILLREDPSLQITQDDDTGQTLLSGMGELHLEIAGDRLIKDLKANAQMGRIEIGYRETITGSSEAVTKIFDSEASGKKGKAGCTATIEPYGDIETLPLDTDNTTHPHTLERDGNRVTILTPNITSKGRSRSTDNPALHANLNLTDIHTAFTNGALAALARGPKYRYPMRNIHVTLTFDSPAHLFGTDTTPSSLTSAARLATIAALKQASSAHNSVLMEPVMSVTISVDESSLGTVIHDISSSRGGHIISLDDDDTSPSQTSPDSTSSKPAILPQNIYTPPDPFGSSSTSLSSSSSMSSDHQRPKTIKAKVPLKEMVGYLKHLRSMTQGRGTFVMSVDRFEKMSAQREKAVLGELRGL
ncbi:putative elongation factor g [Phaeomoniella chlamydospora]|uniref:Ribosome-releasing factor 2, mitochondrial n=1 Tax=Phaeomoniella chlamydospora TaxID=158046 RepID=A0A0G2EIJ3_PHACM|nr:putative elongation factor g [Phaeomoniella chlamydospora]